MMTMVPFPFKDIKMSYMPEDESSDKKWPERLIENTPLAIVVIGVVLVLLAASSGW